MSYSFNQDIFVVSIIILLSLIITSVSSKILKIGLNFNFLINILVASFAFFKFSLEKYNPSDSSYYYESGIFGVDLNFGTNFISSCSGFLSNQLNFEFMPIFFIFSIFCIFAIQVFYRIFLDLGGMNCSFILRNIILLVIVIPISFWGAGLNKEGIALLGIALFCFSLRNNNINKKYIFISILLILLSRPHIGVVAIFSIFFGVLFGKNAKKADRVLISAISIVLLGIIIPYVLIYIGVDELSTSYLSEKTNERAQIYADTSGYINLIGLSPPLRILSYLFRPFLWEASSILQLLASVTNIATLLALVYMYKSFFRGRSSIFTTEQLSYIVFIIMSITMLGMTTSNLGISNRQKWMVVIPLLLLLLNRRGDKKANTPNLKN
jgi:hypothetical protein